MTGNRCNHDPRNPRLSPAHPISKGKGGKPRILSLAAERAKAWYWNPKRCPPLCNSSRKTRSERREALQIVIESILSHLDLSSLCLGTPTLDHGFIDVDMGLIVRTAGIGQRRVERAIVMLKDAGFLTVTQPRNKNDKGEYYGLRAIRVISTAFFDWLGLGPMLAKERRRATAALHRRAAQARRKLSDLMHRITRPAKPQSGLTEDERRAWSRQWGEFIRQGMEVHEAKRRTNAILGYPSEFSPGQASPQTPPKFSKSPYTKFNIS